MTVENDDTLQGGHDTQEGGQDTQPAGDDTIAGVIATFEGETPENEEQRQAPQWVRDMRKTNREQAKRIRELEAVAAAAQKPAEDDPGKEPELEDFDYDTTKFKQAYREWNDKAAAIAARKRKAQEDAQAEQDAFNARIAKYNKDKEALGDPYIQEAEDAVNAALSPTQIGILIHASDNPAELVSALGASPAKLKELADITNPVRFAAMIGALQTKVKTVSRKAPAPEKPVQGNAGTSAAVSGNLEKLREEAARTGDYTKVRAFKEQQKKKA